MSINMTQDLTFETDSLESFETMLRAAVEVLFDKKPSEYVQLHLKGHAATWRLRDGSSFVDGEQTRPTRVWVTTLADYKSGMKEGDVACSSPEVAVDMIMAKVRDFDPSKLREECGDGYNDWFNHFDGSIGVAYRMCRGPNGGWNELYISLAHAYYGK